MSFTVHDFQDLLELLQAHPDWRHQLLSVLLPEDVLAMPAELADVRRTLQELAESHVQLVDEVRRLAESQARLVDEVRQLAEAQARLVDEVRQLAEAQRHTDKTLAEYVASTDKRLAALELDVSELKGMSLEMDYWRKAAAIFGRWLVSGREATNQVARAAHLAEAAGQLNKDEVEQIFASDLLWQGKLQLTGEPIILVFEISWRLAEEDIQRATARAALLRRIGLPAIPVAAGNTWPSDMFELAIAKRIVIALGRRVDPRSWDAAVAAVAA